MTEPLAGTPPYFPVRSSSLRALVTLWGPHRMVIRVSRGVTTVC